MRPTRILPLVALLVVAACTDIVQPRLDEQPTLDQQPLLSVSAATTTDVAFTMAVTEFGSYSLREAGRSGRGMIRDYHLSFDVEGDLEGTAQMVLNANFDADFWWYTGPGVAPTWGTLAIFTADGAWEGNLTGEFVYDPAVNPLAEQLFSKVNLHGPDGAKLKAQCDETSPESEVVACTGQILRPHG